MKKFLILLFISSILFSCKTNHQIVEKIVYRDTVIHVKLPYQDTVKIHKTLINEVTRYQYKDSIVYIYKVKDLSPIFKKNGIIESKVWLKNYRLNVQSYLTDSTVLTRVKNVYIDRTITDYSQINKLEKQVEKKDIKIKRKNKVIGFFIGFFISTLLIIIAIFFIKRYKNKLLTIYKNLKL